MTADRESQAMQDARAEVYLFFAGVFRESPTLEFIDGLLSAAGQDIVAKLFPDHPALGECRELVTRVAAGNWTIEDFQVDFEGLLRVPGARYVEPYESVHREAQANHTGRGKAQLMGEPARRVAKMYQEAGFGPAPASTAPFPDELAVELEFIGRLCGRAAAALEAGDPDRAATATAMQIEFLREHLLGWAFACLDQIAVRAETPLYKVQAQLLRAFLEQEAAWVYHFGSRPPAPPALADQAPNRVRQTTAAAPAPGTVPFPPLPGAAPNVIKEPRP